MKIFLSLIIFFFILIVYVIKNSRVIKLDKADPSCQQTLLDLKRYKLLSKER